ncbi:unnamed protein product [Ilex paraguariensis]|uniref:WD repeat-containing protein 44 n=1 Tax=Ilex paraguariensis TaxID=185542 RepID=A0ABC8TYA7_9AQUA
MEGKRTLTMNWEGLGEDDDDDRFFETFDRISSAVSLELASSDSSEDEFDESRMSFASALSSASINSFRSHKSVAQSSSMLEDYDMWTAEPESITDRRKRLLQGMGLSSNKDLLRVTSTKFARVISKKIDNASVDSSPSQESNQGHSPSIPIVFVRSRSDGDIESFSASTKQRKEELIGSISKQRITRTSSVLLTPSTGICHCANSVILSPKTARNRSSIPNNGALQSMLSDGRFDSFFLIKNLDTGKEFIVREFNEEGMWNKLSDIQTGKQLTMEEFEKCVGHSPVVKELMRRQIVSRHSDDDRKVGANSYLSKSFRYSKRRGVALLKNIKGVANTMSGLIVDKEREHPLPADQKASKNSSSEWVKVRQHGKHYKEFTGLHLCQEIQAHEGSIWTIKFSLDAHYLATAGEDRVIRVWEVQDCDVMPTRPPDDLNSASATPLHPMACSISDRPPLAEITPMPSEKKKKGKNSNRKKGNSIPDYVQVPESVFALSEKPACTFTGHLDDVLDLSWSSSQLLLSSSMDKTVRLWDMESKSCLKLFAHNDYGKMLYCSIIRGPNNVTCIQFNPVDDDYFISGSLDGKVRIWSIPDRQVVDWTDLHEMVTAACYTPDGQVSTAMFCYIFLLKVNHLLPPSPAWELGFSLRPSFQVLGEVSEIAGLKYSFPILFQSTPSYTMENFFKLNNQANLFWTGAVIGSHKGSCRLYSIVDCKLEQKYLVDIPNKKKAQAKKITGFQFAPWSSSEVLITSADSRIRLFDGSNIIHKFRGFRNTSSQILASFSPDGKYVISASEDSQVYIWKHEDPRNIGTGKSRSSTTVQSHEHFKCRDVSVAIPWPGSIRNEPPIVEVHSKRHSKRSTPQQHSSRGSPTGEDSLAATQSKRQLPPLPKRSNVLERSSSCPDEDPAQLSHTDSGIGASESFASASASLRYGDSPSISASSRSQSWSSSWPWFDGGNSHGSHTVQATAWGMVIVAAGLGGEIRVYQNFGLPLKVGR